jgi:hypothetical protein
LPDEAMRKTEMPHLLFPMPSAKQPKQAVPKVKEMTSNLKYLFLCVLKSKDRYSDVVTRRVKVTLVLIASYQQWLFTAWLL